MKTIYTILPIYDSLIKRDNSRTNSLVPVYCPRQRLSSWQYNTEAIVVGAVTRIDLVDKNGNLRDITTYFTTLSDSVVLTIGTYYKYDGDTLLTQLPFGIYYLKITHANGYYFYSDWLSVEDMYPIFGTYTPNFIRIDFHNTNDLGDIYYRNGFTQTVWLRTQLAPPLHEPVEVLEEKNGISIIEKIVTKFKFRLYVHVGRELYRALIRLPQHDTITITDEVGNIYTPKIGNVWVNPINWNTFDTGTLEILWNDNSEFVWVSNNANLT